MKSIFLPLFLLFLNFSCIAQIEWFDGVGSGGNVSQGKSATDNLGNTYSVGSFTNNIYLVFGIPPYGAVGEADVFVKKLNANGDFVWGRTFGGNFSDKANSVSINNQGDIIITGFFEDTIDLDPSPTGVFNVVSIGDRDVFIVKFTSDGDLVWGKTIGTTGDDEGLITELTPSGNCWISGSYSATYIDLDPSSAIAGQSGFAPKGSFFVEISPQGDYLRGFVLNSTSLTISGIGSTENNGLCVSGHFVGPLDIDPGPISEYISSPSFCTFCPRGFVVKVDSLGVMDWYRAMGDGVQDHSSKGGEVKVAENGNIFAYGQYIDSLTFYSGGNVFELFPAYSGYHGYLMKFSPEGVIQWANSIDCEYIETRAMTLHGDEVVLTGEFKEKVDFDPSTTVVEMTNAPWTQDAFIASYDTLLGSFNWVNVLRAEIHAYARFSSIAYDDQGSFYGSGKHYHAVDFDPGLGEVLITGANGLPFLIKYNNTLNVPNLKDADFSMEVFPNPVTDHMFVSFSSLETFSIEMMDQSGQCVLYLEDAIENVGIDVSNLSKGMYILRVRNSEGFAVRKVVVY